MWPNYNTLKPPYIDGCRCLGWACRCFAIVVLASIAAACYPLLSVAGPSLRHMHAHLYPLCRLTMPVPVAGSPVHVCCRRRVSAANPTSICCWLTSICCRRRLSVVDPPSMRICCRRIEGRQDMCPKHVLGTCSGTGRWQDSLNYYWADLDRTNSDKAWKKARTRFYFPQCILLENTFWS